MSLCRAQKEHVAIPSPSYDLIERHLILLGEIIPNRLIRKKLKDRDGAWRVFGRGHLPNHLRDR